MSVNSELKTQVHGYTLEVNSAITSLAVVRERMESLGLEIVSLTSHNLDVAQSGGLMSRTVPEDIRVAINHLKLAFQILENYRDSL